MHGQHGQHGQNADVGWQVLPRGGELFEEEEGRFIIRRRAESGRICQRCVAAGPDSLKVDDNPADLGRCGGWVQEAGKRRRGETRGLST